MNSFIITSSAYPSSSTSAYTVLQSRSERSVPCPTEKTTSFWRKFIHSSTQPLELESTSTMILLPTVSATNQVLTILESASLSNGDAAGAEAFFHFLDELEAGAYAADDVTTEQ